MKAYLYILLLLMAAFPVLGQDRNELWTKLIVNKVVHPKWSIGLDFQYRSQANYYIPHNHHICEDPLVASVRFWIYYKLPKNWTITTAPIAYFYNTDIMADSIHLTHLQELRTMWGISKNWRYAWFKNKNRAVYEARFMNWNKTNAAIQHRYRLQNVGIIALVKMSADAKLKIYGMNELIWKTQQGKSSFDQNRSFLALQVQYKNIELTSGYQFIYQKGNTNHYNKNIWLTSLNFDFL